MEMRRARTEFAVYGFDGAGSGGRFGHRLARHIRYRASASPARKQAEGRTAGAAGADGRLRGGRNWPKPLPDTDLPHAGWTWGSGAGVWAESPDKVWVSQRGEIELPPGATPWICPCLLDPRRTNTGRRPYSGKGYTYQMRRHHLVFAVDRNGNTIEEWLQHDEVSAPRQGHGTRRARPRTAQAADQPVRSSKSTSGSSTTTCTRSTSSPTTASW